MARYREARKNRAISLFDIYEKHDGMAKSSSPPPLLGCGLTAACVSLTFLSLSGNRKSVDKKVRTYQVVCVESSQFKTLF